MFRRDVCLTVAAMAVTPAIASAASAGDASLSSLDLAAERLNLPAGPTQALDVTGPPYNADPTGVNDSTAAIQAAINAAGTRSGASPIGRGVVHLPSGQYRIKAPLVMDLDYVTLEGDGAYSSLLVVPSGVADLNAVVQVGSSRVVERPQLRKLGIMAGRDVGHTSGHGITINASMSILQELAIFNAPQDGIRVDSTQTTFDHHLSEIYINRPGRDGLFVGPGVFDSDFVQVCVKGGGDANSKGGRHGIQNMGSECHYLFCHPYFMAGNGVHCSSGSLQWFGGEAETNGGCGICFQTILRECMVSGNTGFYGNVTHDIQVSYCDYPVIIRGNVLRSVGVVRNIWVDHAENGVIDANTLRYATSTGVHLDLGANSWTISGNHILTATGASSAIRLDRATNCIVTVNETNGKDIVGANGTDKHIVSLNRLGGGNTVSLGAGSLVLNNV